MNQLKCFLPIACLLVWFGSKGQVGAANIATVEITTITVTGESMDDFIPDSSAQRIPVVELINTATGKNFQGSFRRLSGTGIPYGTYILRLLVPGFKRYEQIVRVYQPNVSIRAGLSVILMDDEPVSVFNGTVRPAPRKDQSMWAKLLPLVNNGSLMDAHVRADGKFVFAGYESGEYILLLMKGTQVIYSKQIHITNKDGIDINIEKQ